MLVDVDRQAAFLAQVRAAAEARGVHLVINARVDSFLRKVGDADTQLADGIRRGRASFAAGADCVYPISLADRDAIARFVDEMGGLVNIILRRTGLTVPELAALGVHRVSLGGGLHALATAQLRASVEVLAAGGTLEDAARVTAG